MSDSANGIRHRGKIGLWRADRGWGFVRRDDQQDVFVHSAAVGGQNLSVGDLIEFSIVSTAKGPQAKSVVKVSDGPVTFGGDHE
jgi:cold shock protein